MFKFLTKRLLFVIALLLPAAIPVFAANNPSAFVPPPGNYASTQGSQLNYVTPQMFGAKCDGTTNDATALQNAENAAYSKQAAVAFIGPNYCKTLTAITPKPGVDHYCYTGLNGATTLAVNTCGVLQSTANAWAYDMPSTTYGSSQAVTYPAPTFHDMSIDSAGGGIRIGLASAGTSQAVADHLKIDRVAIGSSSGNNAIDATMCFYCQVTNSLFVTPVKFYESDYVNLSHNEFNGPASGDPNPLIQFLSDSTFGNDDVAEHNFVECSTHNTGACIRSNAQSWTFRDNGVECGTTILASVIDISAPSSEGAFQNVIENNNISCSSSVATNWLTVENTQFLYLLTATGNICNGCNLGSARFNSGNGMPVYVPSTSFLSQIFHSGNNNDSGFPWRGWTNIPDNQGLQNPGLLASISPGGYPYNLDNTNYGATVSGNAGAWVLPSGSKELDWLTNLPTVTGTLDFCFLASAATGTATPVFTAYDNGSSVGTSTPTLTTALSWSCVSNVSVTTKAQAAIVSASSGNTINVFEIIIRQHGI